MPRTKISPEKELGQKTVLSRIGKAKDTCAHRFVLEPSNSGSVVQGVCSLCGLVKPHINYWQFDPYRSQNASALFEPTKEAQATRVDVVNEPLGLALAARAWRRPCH